MEQAFLTMLEQARSTPGALWNTFIAEYRPSERVFFIFHEGKDDPVFYRRCAVELLNEGYELRFVHCGRKSIVLDRCRDFASRFSEDSKVIFVVDRDYDEFLGALLPTYRWLWITEFHSIENHLSTGAALHAFIVDHLGIADLDVVVKSAECKYEEALAALHTVGEPIMAWILAGLLNGSRANLSNIQNSALFTLSEEFMPTLAGEVSDVLEYLNEVTGLSAAGADVPDESIAAASEQLREVPAEMWFRGKQVIWLCVAFIQLLVTKLKEKGSVRQNVQLTESNVVQLLSPGAPIPASIREFFSLALECQRTT